MWEPFALTASAPPLPQRSGTVIGLLIPAPAMAHLSVTGRPMPETVIPLVHLDSDSLSDDILDSLYQSAASLEPVRGEVPNEFGLASGHLWMRPRIGKLAELREHIAADLATFRVTAVKDPMTFLGEASEIPDQYTLRAPEEFIFDRLAVISRDDDEDVIEVPLGPAALLATSGSGTMFAVDGDLLESIDPYRDPMTITDQQIRSGVLGTGSSFVIPLLVPEGVPTGDGRIFEPMSLTTRDLPLPLMWQIKSGTGHDGSVLVGRIDSVERTPQGLGNAVGVFDSGPYGRKAERLVSENAFHGITLGVDGTTVRSVILGTPTLTAAGHVTEFANEGLTPFHIPVVVPTNTPTGDGRIFDKNSLSHRELPIPLLWQPKTAAGHDGSVVVGRIDSVEVRDDGLYNARGYLDNGTNGKEVERLIRLGMLRGVSADLDQFEASASKPAEEVLGEDKDKSKTTIKSETIRVSKARSMAVTVVSKPAFEEAFIILGHPQEGEGDQRREYA